MTDIERASKKPLVMISGAEDLLKARALTKLLESVSVTIEDFDVQVTDAQSTSMAEWKGAASTCAFLADRRVVIVRHLLQQEPPEQEGEKPKKPSKVEAKKSPKGPPMFADLPESALLILVADAVGGSEERQRTVAKNCRTWEKIVAESGGAILKFDTDPNKTKALLREESQALGVDISDRAMDALVDMTGGSFSRCMEEFEKLTLFVEPTLTISERHVETVVTPSKEWNVFRLTDSVLDKNVSEALRQLRTMVGDVSKSETAAFSSILPQTSRVFKLLWQARISLDLSENLQSPSPQFTSWLPTKPSILSEQVYRQQRFVRMAKKTSLHSLQRCLSIIADTDTRLKGGLPSFSAIDTLEMMVLELTTALA